MNGNIDAVAAIMLGANTVDNGIIRAGGDITLGDGSHVSGIHFGRKFCHQRRYHCRRCNHFKPSQHVTGSLQAGATITMGANSVVSNSIHVVADITLGANSHVIGIAVSDARVINYGSGATVNGCGVICTSVTTFPELTTSTTATETTTVTESTTTNLPTSTTVTSTMTEELTSTIGFTTQLVTEGSTTQLVTTSKPTTTTGSTSTVA